MASRGEVADAIEKYLEANWSATKISFENIDEKNPDDPTKLLSEGKDPYIFSATQFGDSNAAEIGRTFRRTHGVLYMEVRIPDGKGTRLGHNYISQLQSLIEYQDIGDARMRGSSSSDGFSSGGWYILPLSFKFRYDRQE